MNNEYPKTQIQHSNRFRIGSLLACLVVFIAVAVLVVWIEIRFGSTERPERPAESACSNSASCSV